MTDIPATTPDTAKADIAFLRDLVDGDPRPGIWGFGATYVAIGLAVAGQIVGTDYLDGLLAMPDWTNLAAIVVVWSAYAVAQAWISNRMKRLAGPHMASGLRGRAAGAAFIGMVLSHLVMLAVFIVLAVRMQDGLFPMLAALSFFAVQAAMWIVLHAMSRQPWQLVEALAWLVAAVGGAIFVGTPVFPHWVFGAVLLLMVLPGALILRSVRGVRS